MGRASAWAPPGVLQRRMIWFVVGAIGCVFLVPIAASLLYTVRGVRPVIKCVRHRWGAPRRRAELRIQGAGRAGGGI